MPFRAKFKRALGGTSTGTSSPGEEKPQKSFLNKTSARTHRKTAEGDEWPDNVYKPWEQMPRPKYRGPWNQAHQDKLSAFSFSSSSRRRRSSGTGRAGSEYSPMGSKLPSRGASRRSSLVSGSSLRRGSVDRTKRRPKMGSRNASNLEGNEEIMKEGDEGSDGVGNGESDD